MKEREEDTLIGSAEQGRILGERTEGEGGSETPKRRGGGGRGGTMGHLSVTNVPWHLAVPNALAVKTFIFIFHF